MERFRRVSVIGLGYIGLPTSAVLAAHGVDVVGVDVNPDVVESIRRGETHIVEPDLNGIVRHAVAEGRLRATTTPEPADAFLIAVPTPLGAGNEPVLDYVESASREIAPALQRGSLVILESTSPIGTTEKVAQWLKEERPDLSFPQDAGEDADVQVAHCPERVLPGRVITELVENDRVIGGLSQLCAERARDLYLHFVKGECALTTARTAEMVKVAENTYRDVNIALANEMSMLCDRFGIDAWEAIALANRHPRVSILQPGPGVGGHCIAVDPWFLIHAAPDLARLIRAAREVNDGKTAWVVERSREMLRTAGGQRIALLGLSYKADIDDLRESPAVEIAEALAADPGIEVLAADPYVDELPASLARAGVRLESAESALELADVAVLLVDHRQFEALPAEILLSVPLLDTRGVLRRRDA